MSETSSILSEFDFSKKKNWIQQFYDFDVPAFEKLLRQKDESFWQKAGERRALKLFHLTAERVPAYKDFLKKNRISQKKIKTIHDFQFVPPTDKKNYIQTYPIASRCWDGKLPQSKLIAVSTGTTGEPTFWPRGSYQEFEATITHELLYNYLFNIGKYRTLLIITFPMGVYVSGVATVLPSWMIATKGYPLTIATVGTNKAEVIRISKNIQNDFDQIIVVGHPLAVKDIIETGKDSGVNWKRKKLHLMFCSEDFSEIWREYVARIAGIRDSEHSMLNTYGSSEMLLMGFETPLSIALRKILVRDKNVRQAMLSGEVVPHLFQYNPLLRFVETSEKEEFLFTSASGIPLIRFNLHDSGQLFSFESVQNVVKAYDHGPSVSSKSWKLPFLALRGRSDHTIIFYAANIYPEHIRIALSVPRFLKKITGKFAMRKGYKQNMEEFLEINIELKAGVRPDNRLAHAMRDWIVQTLKKLNIEYLFISKYDKDMRPRIKLWPYQYEKYFKPGLKPRYIVKEQ